jgi:CHASE2 domain-containing sensor protein
MGNLLLSNAIQEAGNVVLVSKFHQTMASFKAGEIDVYDSIEYSDTLFQQFAYSGFANLPTANKAMYQEDVKICRAFVPRLEIDGREELAFAVKLAMMYDSARTSALLERNKKEELIFFRGNIEAQEVRSASLKSEDLNTTEFPMMFYFIDAHDVLNGKFLAEAVRDKVVILGFLGSYFGEPAWEDKFFTPLNRKVAGRANPDMFGVVIHANIVSMILNGDFVDELEEWQKYCIAFIFCFLNMALFFHINAKYPVWFDSLSLIIQVAQILLLMGLTVMIFGSASFKLDLTITIVTIALAGPVFAFYDNVLTSLVRIWKNKRLTNRQEKVLTTQNQDIS